MATDDAPPPGLRHVTHELRARLAAATAAVEGLRDSTVTWTDEDRRELLSVAQSSLDQIRLLITELGAAGSGLGLTSIPQGSGTPLRPLLAAAVSDLGEGIRRPSTRLPSSLPPVLGDPAVVRLILVGVLRHTLREPDTRRLDVRAETRADRVVLRIGGEAPADDGWLTPCPTPSARADRLPPLGADVSVARDLAQLLGGTLRAATERSGDRALVLEFPSSSPQATRRRH